MRARAWLRFQVTVAVVALSACSDGGGGPGSAAASIQSFTADTTLVRAGNAVEFTAVFDGEDAVLVPGGLSVTSGVPVSVSPSVDTTYALIVAGGDGSLATAGVEITVVDFLFEVVSDADSGPGTLREAMADAAAAPVLRSAITFGLPTPATITIASDLPNIVGVLHLVGPGDAADLAIDGAGAHRLLFVDGGRAVVSDITLQHGQARGGSGGTASPVSGGGGGGGGAGMGGAAFLNAGILSCTRVRLVENGAIGGAGGAGGHNTATTQPQSFWPPAGGGGGGTAGPGAPGNNTLAGAGGPGGSFGGAGGVAAVPGNGIPPGAGGDGAGGGGGPGGASAGPGGFGGGGGGSGIAPYTPAGGGPGGFGAGGGGGVGPGIGGTHGGTGASGADPGGGGGAGLGGAIFARVGSLVLVDCEVSANSALGGAGGGVAAAGQGKGGAIYVLPTAAATIEGTTFTGNTAADDTATPGDDDNIFGTTD